MPTIGPFHTHFWEVSDTSVQPVRVSNGGYPLWQASVVAPSLLGVLGAWLDTRWSQLQWYARLCWRVWHLGTPQRAVIIRVLDLLESPEYPAAKQAVRQTATTLGFSHDHWKVKLSRTIKDSPGRAENIFRHMHACALTRTISESTLTNPTCDFLVELAYQEYALKPWR